nr:hypothetical protein [uncultured bacterium]
MKRSRKPITTCSFLLFAACIACASASPKILTPATHYRHTSLIRLVTAYKHSFIAQGFRVVKDSTETLPSGSRRVRLVLSFVDQARRNLTSTKLSYEFFASDINPRSDTCAPCSVIYETLQLPYDEYAAAELSGVISRLNEATEHAEREAAKSLVQSGAVIETDGRNAY